MNKPQNPINIIASIEEQHGFPEGELRSEKVSRYLSGARREAILSLRALGLSWSEIGRHLNRDHSSVIKLVSGKPVNKSRKTVEKRVDKKGKKRG